MNSVEVLEVGRDAVWVLIKVSAPIMLIALGTGLIVSLFQALTQIQEQTLTFVPKMLVVFVSLVLLGPYMVGIISDFAEQLSDRIVGVEKNDGD